MAWPSESSSTRLRAAPSRRAAGLDRVDRLQERQRGIDRSGGNDNLHLAIEGDDGKPIAGRLAGMTELFACQRAGAIDHQREVQTVPVAARLAAAAMIQHWAFADDLLSTTISTVLGKCL